MTIYELNHNATPRPDNPGNCDRRTRALRRFMNHANAHYMDALKVIAECHSILDSEYPDHDPRHPSQWLDEKLKELEEVEP